MSEHKISMRKLNRAFHETSLSVRNHPEQEAELTHYLLDSLGLLASRLANQGPDSLEEICTQIGSGIYSAALEHLKARER